MPDSPKLCVIQTPSGMYWRSMRGGYTSDLHFAGIYAISEAESLVRNLRCGAASPDRIIDIDTVKSELRSTRDHVVNQLDLIVSLETGLQQLASKGDSDGRS